MRTILNNLPLYKKILLFSFMITFLIVAMTAAFSFFLQTKQMKEHLTDHALDVAALWSTTIEAKNIESVVSTKDAMDPHYQELKANLSVFNKQNSIYVNSYIVGNQLVNDNEIYIISSDQNQKENGWKPLSSHPINAELLNGYKTVQKTNKPSHTKIYHDKNGTWITAFSPIYNSKNEMIAMFGVTINAGSIENAQKKYILIVGMLLLLLSPFIFLILRKVVKKILEPVNQLIYGFNEINKGNFEVKIKVTDNSELSVLSEKFNYLAKQLSILVEKLGAASDKIATSTEGKIKHDLDSIFDEVDYLIEKSIVFRELQRAEKMNAIGQLAASVAHEIRNPMTVVKGFLQIFLAKEQMSEEERMYIRLMIEEMNRAETIINDYLSLAKPDMEKTESIKGDELAEKAMDLMNSYAKMSKNITMSTVLIEKVELKGNKSELQQVLINILKNGIEAMKDGGELKLSLYEDGQYGVFEISDTGIGMTEEEMKRLGTAFYSLKEKGTGMGLTVCYQIIDRMRGRIEVESLKGVGTTFKIYIPKW